MTIEQGTPPIIYVVDTSSFVVLRRSVPTGDRRNVLMKLDHLVEAGQLVYPPEVIVEFERGKGRRKGVRS